MAVHQALWGASRWRRESHFCAGADAKRTSAWNILPRIRRLRLAQQLLTLDLKEGRSVFAGLRASLRRAFGIARPQPEDTMRWPRVNPDQTFCELEREHG